MVVIGLENVLVLTKSVVSTPVDLEVKLRIAQGGILLWGTAGREKWGEPGAGRGERSHSGLGRKQGEWYSFCFEFQEHNAVVVGSVCLDSWLKQAK